MSKARVSRNEFILIVGEAAYNRYLFEVNNGESVEVAVRTAAWVAMDRIGAWETRVSGGALVERIDLYAAMLGVAPSEISDRYLSEDVAVASSAAHAALSILEPRS